MLSIAPPPTILLHTAPTDMRKSFDGLTGLIRGTFACDPADGSLCSGPRKSGAALR
jgi:hypothetical protein